MSPSQRYGNRVTASTLKPTFWKTSLDRLVTCSSQVFPLTLRCSLGRCHLPPKKCRNRICFKDKGTVFRYTWGEKKWFPTDRFPHKAEKEAPWPGRASLCWEPAIAWCPVREAEGRHSDPVGSGSWSHHTGDQYAATHWYLELWANEEKQCWWI